MDGAVMNGSDLEFTPESTEPRALRNALGQFATGVTVITTRTDLGPLGITANSFSALSLDPPLVMWAPGKFSRRFEAFAEAEHFAIHVLAAGQLDVAQHFAAHGQDFDLPGLVTGLGDVPLLPDCLARFECVRHAVHPGGDHVIVVGRVLRVRTRAGDGLTFFRGQYGRLQAD